MEKNEDSKWIICSDIDIQKIFVSNEIKCELLELISSHNIHMIHEELDKPWNVTNYIEITYKNYLKFRIGLRDKQ